jgi:hypothetical protein
MARGLRRQCARIVLGLPPLQIRPETHNERLRKVSYYMPMMLNELPTPPAEWFKCWWSPQTLLEGALAQMHAIPGNVPGNLLFNNPALKPLREAYAAAKFATIRGQRRACEVRLVDPATKFPDFEIRLGDVIEQFEQTEADREGRRRGDEYREADQRVASGSPAGLKHYDPDEEMLAVPQAISVALECKAKKHYRPRPHLLVYVNFPTDNGRPPLKDLQAMQLVEPYRETFLSIWLLWGDNAVRCWPGPPANIPFRKATAG